MQIQEPTKQWLHLPDMRQRPPPIKTSSTAAVEPNELRLPLIGFLPNKLRNHLIATVGEFVGTFLFLFCAFAGTQVANAAHKGAGGDSDGISNSPDTQTLTYIAMAFGLSLATNAWVFFRISGSLFNPAVTLTLCLIGSVGWLRGALVAVAQILGATTAAAVVACLFPGPLQVATTLGGGTSTAQGVFIEALLTAQLVLTIIMLAAEKHKGTFLAPLGIGLSLFVAELVGVYFTGGSLNPARSFGPCVVLHEFPGYHWLYWVGPCLGGIVAALFYHFVKILEYETANPGADFNELGMQRFAFDEENAATGADVQRPDLASPPLAPTVAGYRGRSASTRTRHLSPSPMGIDMNLSDSTSQPAVHEKSSSDLLNDEPLTPPMRNARPETPTSSHFLTPPR